MDQTPRRLIRGCALAGGSVDNGLRAYAKICIIDT